MKIRIEKELSVLLMQPLIDMGRAGNLVWLSFGERVITIDRNGCKRLKGKYALHIQCSWRLTDEGRIIVASRDIYLPRTGLSNDDFDWDKLGVNRFDEKIDELKKRIKTNTIVTEISADIFGGLKISFNSGIRLEIFPDDSLEDEFWRLIVFEGKSKHFVVFEQ